MRSWSPTHRLLPAIHASSSSSHTRNAVLLILVLLEHGILEPLRRPRALRINMGDPEMRNRVLDDEERRDRKRPDEPTRRPRDVMLDSLALALRRRLLDPVWLCAEPVYQSCKTDFHNRPVREIHREAIPSDPHKEFVREHILQRRRKPDPGDHHVPADCGEALGVACGAVRDNVVAHEFQLTGPERPFPVLAGVAGDVPAEDDEGGEDGAADLGVAVNEVAELLFGADVAEDDAVEELALEGFYWGG
jgi:hypothetical protein